MVVTRMRWMGLALLLATATTTRAAPAYAKTANDVDIEKTLAGMTLEQKVGQLLFVGFPGTSVTPGIRHWVQERGVGGVALFSRNIEHLEQTARFTRDIQALTKGRVPVFLALDQEGGNVVRVKDGAVPLPGNMALGATRSQTLAYIAGQSLAIDLKLLGFNMNLAPVLDVNSNPKNPVIGIRSYGERPELVADMGDWYIRGQQEMGVVAVAKHFPGHGDTLDDSHFAMPSINANLSRLESIELEPFRRAMEAGLDAVMTAHIALPKVAEEPNLPATLSRNILTGILREKLGFDGVVVTDGLEMDGIVERWGSGRAAVRAIQAGADMAMILWTFKSKDEVYDALLGAVHRGELSEARIDQSVRRILRVKAKRGLFVERPEPVEQVLARGKQNPLHEAVATQIAREAVTLVRNHGDVLPLRNVRYRKVVVVAPPGPFAQRLGREPFVTLITTPYLPTREQRTADVERAVAEGRDADLYVFAAINRYQLELVKRISRARPSVPVALLSFASPYYLEAAPDVDAYVCTYSYLDGAQRAAAEAVLGEFQMSGRLPVTLPGFYAFGHRVDERFAVAPASTLDAGSLR